MTEAECPSLPLPPQVTFTPSGPSGIVTEKCTRELWARISAVYDDGYHDWVEIEPGFEGGWQDKTNGAVGEYCGVPPANWPAREVNDNLVPVGTKVRLIFVKAYKRCDADPNPQCEYVFEHCCTDTNVATSTPPTCPSC